MTNNDMSDRSNIERIVMRRVHLIHALKFIISSGLLSILVSVLALWGIGREVWVARVLQNAPANVIDLPRFYFAAFQHTRLVVQVLVLVSIVALIYLAREIARALAFINSAESA